MYLTKNLLLNQKNLSTSSIKNNLVYNKEIFLKEKQLYSLYNTYLTFVYNFADFSKFLDYSFIFEFLYKNSQLTSSNLINLILLLQNINNFYKLTIISKNSLLLNEYLIKLKNNSIISSKNLFEFYFIKKFIVTDINLSLKEKKVFLVYFQNYIFSLLKIRQINTLLINNIYKEYTTN